MPLVKLAKAARRARMGSVNSIRRALVAAGIPLVTMSPGEMAVDEADLNRFLVERLESAPAPAVVEPHTGPKVHPSETGGKLKVRKKRRQ